jgi:hypothetical protein
MSNNGDDGNSDMTSSSDIFEVCRDIKKKEI